MTFPLLQCTELTKKFILVFLLRWDRKIRRKLLADPIVWGECCRRTNVNQLAQRRNSINALFPSPSIPGFEMSLTHHISNLEPREHSHSDGKVFISRRKGGQVHVSIAAAGSLDVDPNSIQVDGVTAPQTHSPAAC